MIPGQGPTPPATSQRLPRDVWLLGWASFFTDLATEIIYPLMPLFLTRVLGAGAVSLGVIEGVAEATNSAFKVVSGRLSDRWGVRRPLVIAGYSLSSLVRPLVAIVQTWPQLLAIRFADRLGKGIRGAPRDAMLAAIATSDSRGRVYGFHRAMDHAGAVVGPLFASLFLLAYPEQYRPLFALTIVPGLIAVLTLLRVTEQASPRPAGSQAPDAPPPEIRPPGRLAEGYLPILIVVGIFGLGNSADAFLLLRLADVGVASSLIPLLWTAQHVVKAVTSLWGGRLSDRAGRRALIGAGWLLYAAVYAGFAVVGSLAGTVALFLFYGVYFGLTEGAERALVADVVPAAGRGTAFGVYHAVVGIASLLASVIFGLVWSVIGPSAAFALGAGLAVMATALLFGLVRERGARGAGA